MTECRWSDSRSSLIKFNIKHEKFSFLLYKISCRRQCCYDIRVAIQLRDNVRSVLKRKPNRVVLEIENRFGVFSQGEINRSKTYEEKINEEEGVPFEEEYPTEDLEIATSDFMAKVAVPDFRKAWETLGNDNEVLEKFALQFKTMEDAVHAVLNFLGMQPCDGTATIKNAGKPHLLHLSGVFVTSNQVLARAQIALQNDTVVLKIAVRSDDGAVARMVADCIR